MMGHISHRSRFGARSFRAIATVAVALGSSILLGTAARADTFSYTLAQQLDPNDDPARGGFKLYLEDQSTATPRQLSTIKMVLAIRDGTTIRYLGVNQPASNLFQYDRPADYQLKAVITGTTATLYLDGTSIGSTTVSGGLFVPADTNDEVTAGLDYKDSSGTTDYLVRPTGLTLNTAAGGTKNYSSFFSSSAPYDLRLYQSEPQVPIQDTNAAPTGADYHINSGQTVTVTATFRFSSVSGLTSQYPLVDMYGQYKYSTWPGKMSSWSDLVTARNNENITNAGFGFSANYDQYGGYTGYTGWTGVSGAGYFRTLYKNNRWWLISPLGNPCFYLGVDTVDGTLEGTRVSGRDALFQSVPSKTGTYAGAWQNGGTVFSFQDYTLINRYGSTNWNNNSWSYTKNRLKYWGFSGYGKWSGNTSPSPMSVFPVLKRGTTAHPVPNLPNTSLSDIFDPAVQSAFTASLTEQTSGHITDPYIVGWSVGNENAELVTSGDIKDVSQLAGSVPAKKELVDDCLATQYGSSVGAMAAAWHVTAATKTDLENAIPNPSTLPASDVEHMRQHFASRYYSFVYQTIKTVAPNHLYFGFWIVSSSNTNKEDWRLASLNCDVLGFDRYSRTFSDDDLNAMMQYVSGNNGGHGTPILAGEQSFPCYYNGSRGFGLFGAYTSTDAESGAAYAQWVHDAALNKYCVGTCWFQYRDQPITGRDTGAGTAPVLGEHYAFGLVDITDNPKWDMINPMRTANLGAVTTRLGP